MIAPALFSLLAAAPVITPAAPTAPAFTLKTRPYDAQHYRLEVRLGDDGAYKNKLTATLKAGKALPVIELDAYGLAFETAVVDGEAADFKVAADAASRTGTVTVKPKQPIAAGKTTVVELTYSGRAETSTGGFFTATDDRVANALPGHFTHFEPNAAQRFFPCNDTPGDKATSEVLTVVDGRYEVISNGRKERDELFSKDGKNLRRVHWKQEKPHSPYLVALAVAQVEAVPVNEDLPSTLWVPPGSKDRAFVAVDALKGLLNFQQSAVGVKYPWAKLDVVGVPGFYFGGMENTSVIFERTSLLLVDHKNDQLARSTIVGLLAHEVAHQWFGDLVTCNWWDESWLNESFATWLGAQALDDYNGVDNDEVEVGMARRLLEGYFRQEEGPRAHALVVKGSADEAFDSVTYTKGANVLRMLEQWVGKAELKKGLQAYLEKHQYGAVTSDDFFKAVFDSTKKEKELKPFKDAWLYKKGYPVLFTEAAYSGGKLTLTIRQQPSSTGEKGPFVFKLPVVVHRQNEPAYSQEQVITVDKAEVKVTLDVPAAPQWINWNRNFGALAKINPSSISEDQWVDGARHDPDPVWRLISARNLLGAIGAPVPKDAPAPTDAAVNALLDVLRKDASPYVREALLDQLAATRLKQLPAEFAPVLLALVKRPEGLADDAVGYIRVRRAAMTALARVESADGHRYLVDELGKRDIDINYLGAFAEAVARIGTPAALGTLRAAIVTQRGRGMPYYLRSVFSLGVVPSLEVLPAIRETAEQYPGNNEVLRPIFERVDRNRELKDSDAYARFVRDFVLDEKRSGDDLRALALSTLDDVKYEAARQALTTIAEQTTSERLKGSARRVLAANFPPAPAPPQDKDAKKAAPKK
jgi:aminopeptidase N